MSPLWKNPIVDFVEDNCYLFEEGEENRLEHTTMHNKFKSIIEKNLEAFIQDLGISAGDFIQACSLANKQTHMKLLAQLQAADDYMLFKGMMVKRNIAINAQALQQIHHKQDSSAQQNQGDNDSESGEEYGDEEDEIQRAIEQSKKDFVSKKDYFLCSRFKLR